MLLSVYCVDLLKQLLKDDAVPHDDVLNKDAKSSAEALSRLVLLLAWFKNVDEDCALLKLLLTFFSSSLLENSLPKSMHLNMSANLSVPLQSPL